MRDFDIRQVLKPRLEKRFAASNSLIVEELGFDGHVSRIDVAVVNCALHGYEIKSERDTLDRLPSQLAHYHGQFHYVTVVAASKHLLNAMAIAPETVGFIEAAWSKNRVVLRQVRRAKRLSQSTERIARLFWYEEALESLKRNGVTRGVSRLTADRLRELLVHHFDATLLLEELRVNLQSRRQKQHQPKQKPYGVLFQ